MEKITISRRRHNIPHGGWRNLFVPEAPRSTLAPLHRPCRFLQPLLQLRDGLAATPVLFELTSFPRYARESVRLHRPSNFIQVAPIWISIRFCLHHRRRYTGARLRRGANPTKFAGPTSFAVREIGEGEERGK